MKLYYDYVKVEKKKSIKKLIDQNQSYVDLDLKIKKKEGLLANSHA